MDNYDTPGAVAAALGRHAPRRIRCLLDPAVGRGVLVEAVVPRLLAVGGRVVCIDVDSRVLAACKSHLRKLQRVEAEYLNLDFLKWKSLGRRFDCVIMNPPFGATKRQEVPLDSLCLPLDSGAPRVAPLEVAFVMKAVSLLETDGRLLAVLPSSVILGQQSTWLRRYLCDIGRIRYVHELPQFTFSDLESRVYLLVFDKGGQSTAFTLLNHDLRRPFSIRVMRSTLDPELRLDFGFSSSSACLRETMSRSPELAWTTLGDCANIFRGRGDSPDQLERSLHSTDYNAQDWRFSKRVGGIAQDGSARGLRRGDLLLKRVGRDCSRTLRPNCSLHNKQCSDCIFVIRPLKPTRATRLLLATRVVLESKAGPALTERGSGASYVTEAALRSLPIPFDLCESDAALYRRYRRAVDWRNVRCVRAIEAEFRRRIGLATPNSCS